MKQCLIIEDEKASQDMLINKIKTHFPQINIKAIIDNAPEAISYISKHKLDLVFVDNHIKRGRGMDVINHFQNRNFAVIFSTAFSEYAVEALNNNASYYLLKPYSDNEFITAVEKTLESYTDFSKSIVIGSNKESILYQSIVYMKSEGAYTIFYLEGGKTIYTSKNIGYYEKHIPSWCFFRIHHSTIVNTSKIIDIIKNKGVSVLLKNGTSLSVSNRKSKKFIEQINSKSVTNN